MLAPEVECRVGASWPVNPFRKRRSNPSLRMTYPTARSGAFQPGAAATAMPSKPSTKRPRRLLDFPWPSWRNPHRPTDPVVDHFKRRILWKNAPTPKFAGSQSQEIAVRQASRISPSRLFSPHQEQITAPEGLLEARTIGNVRY